MSKETDFDKKIKKLSRKIDVEVFKQNMGFEAELKKLDNEINNVAKGNIEEFDLEKESLSNYLEIGSKDPFVERMRKKLDNL